MTLVLKTIIAIATLVSVPASANRIFGYTDNYSWSLRINESQIFDSLDTGWISEFGYHITSNSNYLAGNLGAENNNWAVFDLSSLSGDILSAEITIFSGQILGEAVFGLYDTNASLDILDENRSEYDAVGMDLFSDLGSGAFYGSRHYAAADDGTWQVISLNAAGLSAIREAAGGQFSVGGSISGEIPVGGVPEPVTWSMMIAGFGLVGGALRRRKSQNGVRA